MRQASVNGPYWGTHSRVPMSREESLTREVVPTSARRERGKAKSTRRPRTSTRALGPVTVYKSREAFEAGEGTVVTPPKREYTPRAPRDTTMAAQDREDRLKANGHTLAAKRITIGDPRIASREGQADHWSRG